MQLTRYTDNALRVLMYLALRPEKLGTIGEIAQKFNMNRHLLTKVIHRLAFLGYVFSVQGRGGGIRLARPAEDITVGMVVRDMEATLDLIDCDTKPCPIMPACTLKGAVNRATESFLAVLDEYTIADIVESRTTLLELVG